MKRNNDRQKPSTHNLQPSAAWLPEHPHEHPELCPRPVTGLARRSEAELACAHHRAQQAILNAGLARKQATAAPNILKNETLHLIRTGSGTNTSTCRQPILLKAMYHQVKPNNSYEKNFLQYHFLPYQLHWIDDDSPLKIIQKSRQVGITYADAFDSVCKASPTSARYEAWTGNGNEPKRVGTGAVNGAAHFHSFHND
jgi:hypothetical protein